MTFIIDSINNLVRASWFEWRSDCNAVPHDFNWIVFSSNGGTALHDNILLFGFIEKEAQPVLVAKVCRLPENGWTLQAEYERLVELWQYLGDEAATRLPKPLALGKAENNNILITNYLSGQSLLGVAKSDLWENSSRLHELALDAAQSLKFLNEMTATPIESNMQLEYDFHKKADLFSTLFSLNRTEIQILENLTQLLEEKTAEVRKKVLIQGDFWHGNMIRGAEHGKLMFIDWQFACWSSDVSFDVYLFLLAGALAAAPYGPEAERARFAAQILFQWRSELIPAYLRAYGSPKEYVLLPERDGMLACCVEMAVRPVFYFKFRHPDDVMWRSLFGELIKLFEVL